MKKKLLSLAVVVLGLSLVAGSTWAYFTAEERAHNVITSGTIGIEIIEKTNGTDDAEVDLTADDLSNIMPGTSVSKIVSVANSGGADAWIRVKVDAAILDTEENPLPLELDTSGGKVPVMDFTVEQGWTKGEDGYYYYNDPVAPGGKTEPFFKEVAFAPEMGNAYQNSTASLTVVAQAVQSANNAIPDDGDVTDIPGWPEE